MVPVEELQPLLDQARADDNEVLVLSRTGQPARSRSSSSLE
jgi:hypothetical protein